MDGTPPCNNGQQETTLDEHGKNDQSLPSTLITGNNQPAPSDFGPTAAEIAAIVATAVAASHAKLTADLQETRNKFPRLEVEISNLHEIINTNAQQIAAATSQATISALTGPESPFVTKEESLRNQEQHHQTQVQLQAMQSSINNMLRAFLASRHHNPTEEDLENIKTPPRPRKLPRGEEDPPPLSEITADSLNTTASTEEMVVDGVGEH
jgi:hypothetical protein